MNKANYYKLYDGEAYDFDCSCIIRVNMPCSELIKDLIAIYGEQYCLDREDEDFDEKRNNMIELMKDGLHEVYEALGLDDSDDFDNKAEEMVDDFIEKAEDDLLGNTEDFVIDTMKDLGIDVEVIDVDEEIEY